jgi:hypothetical protein
MSALALSTLRFGGNSQRPNVSLDIFRLLTRLRRAARNRGQLADLRQVKAQSHPKRLSFFQNLKENPRTSHPLHGIQKLSLRPRKVLPRSPKIPPLSLFIVFNDRTPSKLARWCLSGVKFPFYHPPQSLKIVPQYKGLFQSSIARDYRIRRGLDNLVAFNVRIRSYKSNFLEVNDP